MNTYQRVRIPFEFVGAPPNLTLYGFVRLDDDGEPERTYCASLTPSTWVEGIGLDTAEETTDDALGGGGYYDLRLVSRHLSGEPFEAESIDDAREECAANW